MANRENTFVEITPEVLLKAYACGIFPMAESADDPALYWIEPDMRGIIPLEGFHVPARLARTIRSTPWTVHVDRDFDAVIDGCAEPKQDRARTWINMRIRRIYRALYDRGHCHSVEVYDGHELIGGLYGVVLGRAFFGESMFHRARDASKIALVHLIARLIAGNYRLLDTQYVTEHLKTFGAVEVPKRRYHRLLEGALIGDADFAALPLDRPLRVLRHWPSFKTSPRHHARPSPNRLAPRRRHKARRRLPRPRLAFRLLRRPLPPTCTLFSCRIGRRFRNVRILSSFTVGDPHIVDRMLDRVQARACREHPAREDPLDLALECHFVDCNEGIGVRRLGRRTRIANARRHLERTELHGFVDGDFERNDAAGDFVEA